MPRLTQNLLAGLLFTAAGGFALYLSQDYPVGSGFRMGPGYFPRLLSWLLIALGAGLGIVGLFRWATPAEVWHFRPLLLISIALAAFGFLIERAGLVVALGVAVAISRFADVRFEPFRTVILVLVLLAGTAGVFVFGLGLRLPIWPS